MGSIISAITGGITGNTGGAGMNYQASNANILRPATVDQANQLYGQSQDALKQQQAFLQAIQAQGGLQNQSNVFNQLQGVANGTGPNPAQAMLDQATGTNVANQAALMASQRGSGANVGLMARQAGMQGANIQQQAAGQGATMQAQQAMAALGQMGNMANTQAAQQAAATAALNNQTQGLQSQVLGSIQGQNQADVGMQQSVNSSNAGVAGQVANQQGNFFGNLMSGAGAAMMLADGGVIPDVSSGETPAGPASAIGKWLSQSGQAMQTPVPQADPISQGANQMGKAIGSGLSSLIGGSSAPTTGMAGGMDTADLAKMAMFVAAKGGRVPALVSPGEKYLAPKDVEKVVKQGKNPMSVGEKIPGKPVVGGAKNSYANDTVKKDLEPGGIVLPRSVTQAKDPAAKAAEFVAAVLQKQQMKKSK